MRRLSEQVSTPIAWTDGIPAAAKDDRTNKQKRLANTCILLSTVLERFAFYALTNTLFSSLRMTGQFNWIDQLSKTASYTFSGTTYICTVIFAIITDAKFGRRTTILVGFIFYIFGSLLITITAIGKTALCNFENNHFPNGTIIDIDKPNCIAPVFGTIILTAIGGGAVKANLCVFGAEQCERSEVASRYFHYYVLAVNIGDTIATIVVPLIQYKLRESLWIPYAISTIALLCSVLVFAIGWKFYILIETNETVVKHICPVFTAAIRSWFKYKRETNKMEASYNNGARMRLLNGPNGPIEIEESVTIRDVSTFLDYATAANEGRFQGRVVKDVKSLGNAIAVLTLLIPFWIVYSQSTTTFPLQGENMAGSNPSYIVSYISLGDPVVVIVGIIVIHLYAYKKQLTIIHTSESITIKFITGMIFSMLSMLTAAIVEHIRQKQCYQDGMDSRLSIFAQIPQSIFIGLGQLFGMVSCYEYAYLSAPRSAASLFMSLYFFSMGAASFLGVGLMHIFPNQKIDMDFRCETNYEWYWSFYSYFYILGGIQLVFMIIFILCQRYYTIVKLNPQHIENNASIRSLSFNYDDI